MKKHFLFIIILVFIGFEITAQQWVDKKYQYDSLLNITYGTAINFNGQLDTLTMDIFMPICENPSNYNSHPLLIWVHGGAFLTGNKDDVSIQSLCKSFAKRGYVTASINYRLGFVSDDIAWQCNYPNYSCVFAADSSEWVRAYYRAIQDGNGALRYLINRHQTFNIDTNNIFIAGESAGAITALGVGLMDTIIERPIQTFKIADAPSPHPITSTCAYNQGIHLDGNSISRPDLGKIEGDIEPTSIKFKIKGIGNMYGAMMSDLLKNIPSAKPKPAIYSFHQPCDIVVPIDSNFVFWGLTWCLTNGYNCFGISNNKIKLYGSRVFSKWNKNNEYGYAFRDEFTNINFPFNFLFGQGSCTDQINNPCHAYDNKNRRESELAQFFALKITSSSICDTLATSINDNTLGPNINVFPNPTNHILNIKTNDFSILQSVWLYDAFGNTIYSKLGLNSDNTIMDVSKLQNGMYFLQLEQKNGYRKTIKVTKE